ncbi:MAG: argininosuccinate lyase, partial [Planctomycetota bacterium]
MSKLWQTGGEALDPVVEKFLASDDLVWDQRLGGADILGSAAQVRILVKAGIFSKPQGSRLVRELSRLYKLWQSGRLILKLSDEDIHTRIEKELTHSLGDLGKRIHTGRSRNDQVLTALSLWTRGGLHALMRSTLDLSDTLIRRALNLKNIPMPGYTHMQRAMPMTAGFWLGSFAEAFSPSGSCYHLTSALVANDASCPLGSGSGFGSLVSPDRGLAARLLGFSHGSGNALRIQTARGRIELAVLHACVQLQIECSRLASDILLFSTEEFGLVSLPASLTTGSSLMPNKRNADVCELIRASLPLAVGDLTALVGLQASLPSGYNRDLQPSKGLLIRSVDRTLEVLAVTRKVVEGLKVNAARCRESCHEGVLATDRATRLSLAGVAFRDAYKSVKSGGGAPVVTLQEAIRGKKAAGCPGHPGLARLASLSRR